MNARTAPTHAHSFGPAVRLLGRRLVIGMVVASACSFFATSAHAAGSFKLKSAEVNEVSGGWRIFVTIELPKPPITAHVPMRFLFTKTAVYERSLVDNKTEPVRNITNLQGQNPNVENLDVDFADGSGKVFKKTYYDFTLTRTRGYEAGEYKMALRTSDGVEVGSTVTLRLNGDNAVVDRRTMNFAAKEPAKKADGPKPAPSYDIPSNEVTPVGEAAPFVPKEAYDKVPEEQIRERPKGCGCSEVGHVSHGKLPAGLALALALVVAARSRRIRREA